MRNAVDTAVQGRNLIRKRRPEVEPIEPRESPLGPNPQESIRRLVDREDEVLRKTLRRRPRTESEVTKVNLVLAMKLRDVTKQSDQKE